MTLVSRETIFKPFNIYSYKHILCFLYLIIYFLFRHLNTIIVSRETIQSKHPVNSFYIFVFVFVFIFIFILILQLLIKKFHVKQFIFTFFNYFFQITFYQYCSIYILTVILCITLNITLLKAFQLVHNLCNNFSFSM